MDLRHLSAWSIAGVSHWGDKQPWAEMCSAGEGAGMVGSRSRPIGNVQEGTLLPILLRLTLLCSSLPFSLFQPCLSHHQCPLPASSITSLPVLLWHFTALAVITDVMEKCFGDAWPAHAGVGRGKGWEFCISVRPRLWLPICKFSGRSQWWRRCWPCPCLAAGRGDTMTRGWLCPRRKRWRWAGPRAGNAGHTPQAWAGGGPPAPVLQPHHIPSPPVIWWTRGWLWETGGTALLLGMWGAPALRNKLQQRELCSATSKQALAARQGIVWRD